MFMNITKRDTERFWQKNSNSLLKINIACFPFLWTLAFFISLLESFTYPGFSFKHFFLPFQPLFGISILSGILARLSQGAEEEKKGRIAPYRILLIINRLAFLPLLLSFLLTNSLNLANYPNYVFTKIHLQPQLLLWSCFLSGFLIFLSLRGPSKKWILENILMNRKRSDRFQHRIQDFEFQSIGKIVILRTIIIVLIVWVLLNNLIKISSWMFERSSFMIRHPLATYDEKMRYGWKDFYDYMLFLKRNTPEDAVIMFPPMINPWMDVGGGGLIRYFLYPREIIQNMTDENAEIDPGTNYVMLAWGFGICEDNSDKCHGWPKKKINSEWIIYKKMGTVDVEKKVYNVIYDSKNEINKGAWGVIKIKKN